jgi:hypothetical protein
MSTSSALSEEEELLKQNWINKIDKVVQNTNHMNEDRTIVKLCRDILRFTNFKCVAYLMRYVASTCPKLKTSSRTRIIKLLAQYADFNTFSVMYVYTTIIEQYICKPPQLYITNKDLWFVFQIACVYKNILLLKGLVSCMTMKSCDIGRIFCSYFNSKSDLKDIYISLSYLLEKTTFSFRGTPSEFYTIWRISHDICHRKYEGHDFLVKAYLDHFKKHQRTPPMLPMSGIWSQPSQILNNAPFIHECMTQNAINIIGLLERIQAYKAYDTKNEYKTLYNRCIKMVISHLENILILFPSVLLHIVIDYMYI